MGIIICFSAVLAEGASLPRFPVQSSWGIINLGSKGIKNDLERGVALIELLETPKKPEIMQTCPSGPREGHEKYFPEALAAIKTS